MPRSKIISEFLTLNGAGTTASILPANDTLATWSWVCPAGKKVEIQRIIPSVEDSGNFDAEDYGALGSALTNGMTLSVMGTVNGQADQRLYYLTDEAKPIKTNFDWGAYCYDANVKAWGVGNNFLVARWTFAKSGQPVYLDGDRSERLVLEVSDTLSGLVEHLVLVQGYYITP